MYVCVHIFIVTCFIIKAVRYKRDRSNDGNYDASTLDEAAAKRQKLSPLVTSASTTTTSVCH